MRVSQEIVIYNMTIFKPTNAALVSVSLKSKTLVRLGEVFNPASRNRAFRTKVAPNITQDFVGR